MYSYIPLDLNQLLDVGVDLWFQICIVDTHQRIYVMVKGLLRQLVNFFISVYATMAWYPAETNMCAFVIQQPEKVHDMANKRVLSVFTLNRLQAGHWVGVNYYIVVDWAQEMRGDLQMYVKIGDLGLYKRYLKQQTREVSQEHFRARRRPDMLAQATKAAGIPEFEEEEEPVQESDPEPEDSWKGSQLQEAPERWGWDRGAGN